VFGGTLAGHRRFAEQVVETISRFRPISAPWTAPAALPGGGFPASGGVDLIRALRAAYPFLSEPHALRLVRTYGTRASSILTGARSPSDLGIGFGADLTEAEVNYLRTEEWALTAEDVLWRRSKLGLALTTTEASTLAGWMVDKALTGAPT
jgi:glycerol-3-phosphate dehydrogenase